MRTRSRILVLVTAIVVVFGRNAPAQSPAPESTPPPNSAPNVYPDIDALREPGSTAKLFPAPSPDADASTDEGRTPPNAAGSARRSGNSLPGGVQHRRGQRTNDLLVSEADADPLEVRVAYRRAKTIAMARDPDLADLLRDAANADTEVRKRAILKTYYDRLFADVRKADPSPEVKRHVAILELVSRQRYDPQRRAVGGEEDIVRGGGGRRGRR